MLNNTDISFALEIGCAAKETLYGYKKGINWYDLYLRYQLYIAQNNCVGSITNIKCNG